MYTIHYSGIQNMLLVLLKWTIHKTSYEKNNSVKSGPLHNTHVAKS